MPPSSRGRGHAGRAIHLDFVFLADQLGEHLLHPEHNQGQIKRQGLQHCLRVKASNCRVNVAASAGCMIWLSKARLSNRRIGASKMADITLDDSEQVVELVGDACGQAADNLQFFAPAATGPPVSTGRSMS